MQCKVCGKNTGLLSSYKGRCKACYDDLLSGKQNREIAAQNQIEVETIAGAATIVLTTETAHNLAVSERLGIVSSEAVLGMNVLKDMLADVRGTFGGRSQTIQKGLQDAREICLSELRQEAARLGADAVLGINLDYNDFGTSGKMLAVIATGTAVTLDAQS